MSLRAQSICWSGYPEQIIQNRATSSWVRLCNAVDDDWFTCQRTVAEQRTSVANYYRRNKGNELNNSGRTFGAIVLRFWLTGAFVRCGNRGNAALFVVGLIRPFGQNTWRCSSSEHIRLLNHNMPNKNYLGWCDDCRANLDQSRQKVIITPGRNRRSSYERAYHVGQCLRWMWNARPINYKILYNAVSTTGP